MEAPPEPPLTPLSDTEMLPLPPVDTASKDLVSVVLILSAPLVVDLASKEVVSVVLHSISPSFVVCNSNFVLFVDFRSIVLD